MAQYYNFSQKDIREHVTSGHNFYTVLGVDRSADSETLRKAYRKRAKKLHPDVNPIAPKSLAISRKLMTIF